MTSDAPRAVTVSHVDHVAIIEFARPPHNFLDVGLIAEVADAMQEAERRRARVVVLQSAGKHFCAGADLSRSPPQEGAMHIYDAALRLFEQPLPIVAAMQGSAIGGGLGLALAADFRVAARDAKLGANFARLGIHHGFGLSVTLPLVVGHQKSLDLLYSGRTVGAEEALAIGLVDRVADDQRSEALAFATQLAGSAPLALQSIRRTLRGHLADQIRTAVVHERAEQTRLRKSDDFREGVTASRERRDAQFTGS